MIIGLLVGAAALGGGFVFTRGFVRRRLRYVDAIQKPAAPWIAGAVATAVALPVTALPVITLGTAIAFGVGVAGGVASGRKEPGLLPPS
ncbi:MAG: hypothetical protein AUH78_03920 [Gemmatimonadetes bacterium 13_1_40CM_4_69_8]|nr:MAG: hypothetical protein AUH78_03920 [Gemmatimonadetes bacterium 13_1_40CM_4_69_8]